MPRSHTDSDDYGALNVQLVIDDCPVAIEFYARAFSAQEIDRRTSEGGARAADPEQRRPLGGRTS